MTTDWVDKALDMLKKTLRPIPQELNELDWKERLSTNKSRLTEHLSAFANYPGGGFMVFGICDKTGEVLGINREECNQIIDKLSNLSRNALEPPIRLLHAIRTFQNHPIFIIHIEESEVKPVHLRAKSLEYCFIRSGGTTRKASRQDVGNMLLNSKPLRWEELHSSSLLTSREMATLLDYRTIFELLDRPIPEDSQEIIRWMLKEKMIAPDHSGNFYITNFGAIAAAHKLDDFNGLQRKAVRLIRYSGLNKVQTETEHTGTKGYAIGFENFIQFLTAMLPQSEVIEQALRRKTSIYPEIALRELFANTLIHQDFSISGSGPMVEIFANRIEFSNPGRLLPSKKIHRLIGTNPESRNEILASAFRRYNICEERGTGFLKTIAAIELYGLPPLGFEEGENYFKVSLQAPKTFAEMLPEERLEACYQHATLQYYSSSALSNTSLRKRLKMSERQRSSVSRLIAEALDKKLIKARNPETKSTKFAEYIPFWG